MALNSRRAWSTVARMLAKSSEEPRRPCFSPDSTATAAGESQAPEPYQVYQSAVAAYVESRDISRAVVPLQKWTGTEFDAAVKATIASGKSARSKPRPFLTRDWRGARRHIVGRRRWPHQIWL